MKDMLNDEEPCPNCNGSGKIVKCICGTDTEVDSTGQTVAYVWRRNPKCRADHRVRM